MIIGKKGSAGLLMKFRGTIDALLILARDLMDRKDLSISISNSNIMKSMKSLT